MIKHTIAIDCDDVIVDTGAATLRHYNQTYGASISLKDYYAPMHDDQVWGADEAETIRRFDEYLLTDEYQQQPPFQEAVEVIHRLAQHHDLHIVTGRPDFLRQATLNMLAQYFPDLFKSVEFTNFFHEVARPKSQVCRALGADLLIDDHLHHVGIVAECGIEAFLFGDYPWNQADTLQPNVTRVRDWQEVAKILLPS